MVATPDIQALLRNVLRFFHLCPQEGRDHLAGQVGRPDIHPGVFVYLAAKELAAVSALFTDDLRPFDKTAVIDQ